jgi:hypothetical protein
MSFNHVRLYELKKQREEERSICKRQKDKRKTSGPSIFSFQVAPLKSVLHQPKELEIGR